MPRENIRYINDWRLRVTQARMADGVLWNVIIGTKNGKKYLFSRHLDYDNAIHRMNHMDPDECQHIPYN